MPKIFSLAIFLVVLSCADILAQGISGYVQDENNNPIPYASVFIRELKTGTSTDAEGRYFINDVGIGLYNVTYSSIGYITQSFEVIIKDKNLVKKNVWLKTSTAELDEVVVKAKRRDPAYEIIQKVIANKKKHLKQLNSSKSEVYIKAIEIVDLKKRKPKKEPVVTVGLEGEPEDPFQKQKEEEKKKIPNINLLEMNLTLNYEYPSKNKEERTAVKSYGTRTGLYVPPFS